MTTLCSCMFVCEPVCVLACSLSFYFKCNHVSVIMHVQYAVHSNDIFDINKGVRKVGEGVVCLIWDNMGQE